MSPASLSYADDDASSRERRTVARQGVAEAIQGLDLKLPEDSLDDEVRIADLRRGRRTSRSDRIRTVTLFDLGDGTLVWREGAGTSFAGGRRRRRSAGSAGPPGMIVAPVRFEELKPNQVGAFLAKLDGKLTPNQGLRRWTPQGGFTPIARPSPTKRALLFIHGTFSNSDQVLGGLEGIEARAGLLAWAASQYDQILAFDHPTLSVSPVLNGLDLARLFADVKEPVDIVCHSRGGLVTRWWLEAFAGNDVGPRRVIFVASPLGGTSLASPPKLPAALNFFTSVGSALKSMVQPAAVYLPFLSVAVGLMTVITSITGTVAKTPLLDAAMAMIPGLNCQSRVGNNAELARLHSNGRPLPDYYAIVSDFQPTDEGWKFWRNFVNFKERSLNWAVDPVFDQANDLVVDTRSMTELIQDMKLDPSRVHDFGTNPRVHHTNYFGQTETAKFIMGNFSIP